MSDFNTFLNTGADVELKMNFLNTKKVSRFGILPYFDTETFTPEFYSG